MAGIDDRLFLIQCDCRIGNIFAQFDSIRIQFDIINTTIFNHLHVLVSVSYVTPSSDSNSAPEYDSKGYQQLCPRRTINFPAINMAYIRMRGCTKGKRVGHGVYCYFS